MGRSNPVKFIQRLIRIRHKLMQSWTFHSLIITCHGRQRWTKTSRTEDQPAMWEKNRWFLLDLARLWSRRSSWHRHKEANSTVVQSTKGCIEARYKSSKVSQRDRTHIVTQIQICLLNDMMLTNFQLLTSPGRQDQQRGDHQSHRLLQQTMENGSIREE